MNIILAKLDICKFECPGAFHHHQFLKPFLFVNHLRDVIRLYFGLSGKHPMTLEEIGEKFDLTRERVRHIKEKSIRRLKHTSRSKLLKSYLG